MANAHRTVVRQAERVGDDLKRLFDRLGNTDHPRGDILAAYRLALASMPQAITNYTAAREIAQRLRADVRRGVSSVFGDASALGIEQGRREVSAWDLFDVSIGVLPIVNDATEVVLGAVDQQLNTVLAEIRSGSPDAAELFGDESRYGILAPAGVVLAATRWITTITDTAHNTYTEQAIERSGQKKDEYGLQAIAAIDDKTTDCCLKVHGQIIPIKGEFHLTGTPRFADNMKAPPFHWHCRTATALVKLAEQDDDLTRILQAAAQTEIEARRDNVQDVPTRTNAGSVRPSRRNRLRQIVRNG